MPSLPTGVPLAAGDSAIEENRGAVFRYETGTAEPGSRSGMPIHKCIARMRILVFLALISLPLTGCRTTASLQSSALGDPITVDAQLEEWAGKLSSIAGGELSVGVQNDGDFLYVGISTSHPQRISQIMQQGLVLWIDPAGGKKKAFGVQYPIGIITTSGSDGGLTSDPTANQIRIEQSMQEIALISDSGQAFRRRKDTVPGITMHAEADHRAFTYEAKLPLSADAGILYAIGAEPGQQVGLGLTSPELDEQGLAQQEGIGGLPGGRMASAEGRRRYGMYGAAGGLPPIMNYWMVVSLVDAH